MAGEVPPPRSSRPDGLTISSLEAEKPLAGINGIITGTRDVGGGIIRALTKRGVNLLAVHVTPRADIVETRRVKADPSRVNYFVADITIPENAKLIFNKAAELLGNINLLILNASRPTSEMNEANIRLLDLFIQRMKKTREIDPNAEGSVILLQSVPGKYQVKFLGHPLATGVYFENIAPFKYQGEQEIRAKEEEMKGAGIRFTIVCPPMVPKTGNVDVFSRVDAQLYKRNKFASDVFGFEETTTVDEIGERVVDILVNPRPQGHTELWGAQDARLPLRNLGYSEEDIFLDTIEETEEGVVGRALITADRTEKRIVHAPFVGTKISEATIQTLELALKRRLGENFDLSWLKSDIKEGEAFCSIIIKIEVLKEDPAVATALVTNSLTGEELGKIVISEENRS